MLYCGRVPPVRAGVRMISKYKLAAEMLSTRAGNQRADLLRAVEDFEDGLKRLRRDIINGDKVSVGFLQHVPRFCEAAGEVNARADALELIKAADALTEGE